MKIQVSRNILVECEGQKADEPYGWGAYHTEVNAGTYEILVKHPFGSMAIRTISPKAAARKYIRDNLTEDMAKSSFEYDNPGNGPMDLGAKQDHDYFERIRLMEKDSIDEYKIIVHKPIKQSI